MGPTTIIIMSLYYFTTEQITIKSLSIQKNTFFHESDFATFDNVLLVLPKNLMNLISMVKSLVPPHLSGGVSRTAPTKKYCIIT